MSRDLGREELRNGGYLDGNEDEKRRWPWVLAGLIGAGFLVWLVMWVFDVSVGALLFWFAVGLVVLAFIYGMVRVPGRRVHSGLGLLVLVTVLLLYLFTPDWLRISWHCSVKPLFTEFNTYSGKACQEKITAFDAKKDARSTEKAADKATANSDKADDAKAKAIAEAAKQNVLSDAAKATAEKAAAKAKADEALANQASQFAPKAADSQAKGIMTTAEMVAALKPQTPAVVTTPIVNSTVLPTSPPTVVAPPSKPALAHAKKSATKKVSVTSQGLPMVKKGKNLTPTELAARIEESLKKDPSGNGSVRDAYATPNDFFAAIKRADGSVASVQDLPRYLPTLKAGKMPEGTTVMSRMEKQGKGYRLDLTGGYGRKAYAGEVGWYEGTKFILAGGCGNSPLARFEIPLPAPALPKPIDGACGEGPNVCRIGRFTWYRESAEKYEWQCAGEHGGMRAMCEHPKAPLAPTLQPAPAPQSKPEPVKPAPQRRVMPVDDPPEVTGCCQKRN